MKDEKYYSKEIKSKLKAEIRQLKADIKHDANVCEEYDEGLRKEIKELQAENSTLMDDLEEEQRKVKELKAEVRAYIELRDKQIYTINDLNKINDRLVSQVNYNRSNNSNVRTISGEIAEYISHNPKGMGARLFLIPRNEFKHGEYENTIYWDDGLE